MDYSQLLDDSKGLWKPSKFVLPMFSHSQQTEPESIDLIVWIEKGRKYFDKPYEASNFIQYSLNAFIY